MIDDVTEYWKII